VEATTNDFHLGGQSFDRNELCVVGLVDRQRHAVLHLYPVHPVCVALAEVGVLALLRRSTNSQLDLDDGTLDSK